MRMRTMALDHGRKFQSYGKIKISFPFQTHWFAMLHHFCKRRSNEPTSPPMSKDTTIGHPMEGVGKTRCVFIASDLPPNIWPIEKTPEPSEKILSPVK